MSRSNQASESSGRVNKRVRLSVNIHTCDVCGRTFESYRELQNHMRIHRRSTDIEMQEASQPDNIEPTESMVDDCKYL